MKKITILFSLTFLFALASQAQNCWANYQYYGNQNSLTVNFLDSSWVSGGPASSGSVAYTWYFGDGTYAYNNPYPSHTYAQAGTYYTCLSIYDSLTNCFDSTCTYITVAGPSSSNCSANFSVVKDTTQQFNIILYNNSSTGSAHSYFWDFGDGNTATGQYPTHNYQSFGSYVVCLTVSDSMNNCVDIFCDTLGMDSLGNLKSGGGFGVQVRNPLTVSLDEKEAKQSFKLYPNPAKSIISLDLSTSLETYEIEIRDISGKTVYADQLLQGGKIEQLDVSQLDNGFYFLVLDQNGERNIKKFVISK
ncbi:MAG: PKD domain-containing protein [Vicingaceae bacterium]